MKDSTSLRFKSITAICFGSLMMFSATTEASSFHIEMSQCDVSMQGTLGIENGVMTVTTEQRQALTIDAEQNVKIDGTKLALTASEKALAEQYYYNINAAVPMGIEIAAQGLELSNVAINDILSPLLGEEDEMIIKLNELLSGIAEGLQNDIYDPQGNLSIAPNMNGANWFTPEWEQDFERVLSDTIEQNMGRLMLAIGAELLFGEGNFGLEAFDPDTLAQRVGDKMAHHGTQISEAMVTFCAIVEAADQAETELAGNIESLNDFDVIQYRKGTHNNAQ